MPRYRGKKSGTNRDSKAKQLQTKLGLKTLDVHNLSTYVDRAVGLGIIRDDQRKHISDPNVFATYIAACPFGREKYIQDFERYTRSRNTAVLLSLERATNSIAKGPETHSQPSMVACSDQKHDDDSKISHVQSKVNQGLSTARSISTTDTATATITATNNQTSTITTTVENVATSKLCSTITEKTKSQNKSSSSTPSYDYSSTSTTRLEEASSNKQSSEKTSQKSSKDDQRHHDTHIEKKEKLVLCQNKKVIVHVINKNNKWLQGRIHLMELHLLLKNFEPKMMK